MRLRACVALLACAAWPAAAQPDPALYRCTTIVTGTDQRSRPGGLARCLRQVAAKLAGDPALADDPRLAAVPAAPLVADIAYLDRMTDIPLHDEQGSRDRPFDLVVQFDPARMDAALAGLGRTPWLDRPPLLALVRVTDRGATYALSADGPVGERQRRALLAAGERFGLHLVLPLDGAAAAPDGRAMPQVSGTLRWSDADYGWVGDWTLSSPSLPAMRWEIRGVSFDEAFRSLVGGAAATLSRR